MKKIILPKDDDDLLAECAVQAYRSSGSGGQHVNVTDSAVRLTHLSTGIVVTSQKERSQYLNKRECLLKLRDKVEKLNYRKPKRIATRIPRSVINKNSALAFTFSFTNCSLELGDAGITGPQTNTTIGVTNTDNLGNLTDMMDFSGFVSSAGSATINITNTGTVNGTDPNITISGVQSQLVVSHPFTILSGG